MWHRCLAQAARYACPRCNMPYCSLGCYQGHGERCTESFYRHAPLSASHHTAAECLSIKLCWCREQTEEQLHGTTASGADRERMLQVLQRMQDADAASSTSSSEEEEEDHEAQEAQQLLQELELQV